MCATADCGSGQVQCNGAGAIPPTTLVELSLGTSYSNNYDFYDISLVDGFNLPVSLAPIGQCSATSCAANVNTICPPELAVKESDGRVISCKSACLEFNQQQYCCTGDYATPEKCPPTKYSLLFKNQCPQAYTYAYDDKTSTFACMGANANYVITFCP